MTMDWINAPYRSGEIDIGMENEDNQREGPAPTLYTSPDVPLTNFLIYFLLPDPFFFIQSSHFHFFILESSLLLTLIW
jgi:hypothetical protein